MRQKIMIFCLLTVIGIATASAQDKIELNIIEKGTKQPLVGATVCYAPDKELKQPKYTITDTNGLASFVLSRGGTYYHISMVGFRPLSGKIEEGTTTLTLRMQEKIVDINEVVVKGTSSPHPIKISPVTTQVLSGKAMTDAGYGSLQQALQQETPGLNIQKVSFGNEINMQGLDARHVLFLMDGERMTGDMAGNLDYERFNLHAIDRIEIIKGGSSALYGSRASGAVINLITKKTTRSLSMKAGARYGLMNECNYKNPQKKDFLYMYEKNADRPNLQGWVSAGVKAGAFTSQTDVWYSESDAFYLYQKENDKKTYTREANPFLTKDTVIVSKLARSPMGIEGTEHISASQKLYFEPSHNFKMQVDGKYFFMNTYDLIQDLVFTQAEDFTGSAKATYRLKDWFAVTAILHADYYDRYKRHERRDERKKVYKSRIIQQKVNITSNYFKNHNLILGGERFTDELTSDRFVNRKMTSRALKEMEYFFQDEWSVSKKWMLSAGIRTDFSRQFGFMWMPKISAKYSPNTNWNFRTSFSRGYRSPTIKELFFNWDHLGMFMVIGNEDLKPEKNKYVSVGAEYSNDRFFINTTLYGNFFTDKIEGVWRIYDMQYNFEYTNLGHQNLLGGELLSHLKLFNGFSFNASYSYVNVSKENDLRINTTSPHAASAGVQYRYGKRNYSLTAGFTASYMGRKQFDVQDRLVIESEGGSREAYFRCDLPAYTLCNITLAQTFGNRIKATLGVENVFNYKPETLGSGLTAFNVPATAGARGYIQLEFKINK
jgi:outer membrane receptor for ferrienterochelin and colicins